MIFGPVQEPQFEFLSGDSRREMAFHIEAMVMADQEMRDRIFRMYPIGSPMPKAAHNEFAWVDKVNTSHLQYIVARFGWPTASKFGRKPSHDAWLLVQHADRDPSFQLRCLKLMEPHLKSGEVGRGDYAYLWDRVAVNQGHKQRYGTQWAIENGRAFMRPCEDPAGLDRRRKRMGMVPIKEYERILKRVYGVKWEVEPMKQPPP